MTNPITILHTRTVTGSGGGPDKTILRSAGMLDPARYQAVAAYLHPAGDTGIDALRGTAARFGMDMHTVPERGPIDLRAVRLLRDLCKRLRVDVWHAHDYKTDLLGRLICRSCPMKLVTTMHGFTGETWRTRLYARLSHRALRRYDRVLAVSPQLMRYAAEHGVHPDRLRHIPNGIDMSEYKRTLPREQAKYALGLAKDEHAIGVLARFSIEKGVDRAVRMFAKVHHQRPNTRLHLIGDGPQRGELERLVDRLGLTYQVRWWGWHKDARPILEAMDTLVLPSRTEGLPNTVLEAMAIGLPVAATRVGAVPDVLADGACGVLLADEESAWAEQLLPVIDLPLVRERQLCAAWMRVNEQYNFTKRMRRVEAIYDELMGVERGEQAALPLAA
ncbi:MAG: glycosyltransferase [Phycisphaeraceae bacterium]|nr:glycosyltransferase [Phycisphaeraceae bacterium]